MSLNTSQIVHIVSEVVALLSVTTYFVNENRKMMKLIDSLNEKLDEQDEKMEKYDRVLSDILKTLEKNKKVDQQQSSSASFLVPPQRPILSPPPPKASPPKAHDMGIIYEQQQSPQIPITICIAGQSCVEEDDDFDYDFDQDQSSKVEEIQETPIDDNNSSEEVNIIREAEEETHVGMTTGGEEEEEVIVEIASSNKKKRKKKKKSQTLIDIDKELENELNDLYKEEIMKS